MKKIGILTFHRALNYGAVLQAYALQNTVQNMIYKEEVTGTCEIIDYRNQTLEDGCKAYVKMSKDKGIKHVIAAIINMPVRIIRKSQFRKFIGKYLEQSAPVMHGDTDKINTWYDAVITGSDQVFNDELTGDDWTFLLKGIQKEKYSYAASFGFSEIPEKKVEAYQKCLASFLRISVREESGKDMIEQLLPEKEVKVHVDPTLLSEQEDWEKLCIPIKKSGQYILIYSINPHKHLINFALDCGRKKKLPVYFITCNMLDAKNYKGIKMIYTPTVEQFVSLIKEADTVITNSFHGTVFSTIFHKNFWVEVDYGTKYNHRIADLLTSLSLQGRIISTDNYLDDGKIDWEYTELQKRNYRRESLEYIKQICSE